MSESAAKSSQGTIFKRDSVPVGEIIGISGPGKTRETIEVTRLEDTDGYRKFIGGLRDPGTITVNGHFTRANYLLLNEDYEAEAEQDYEIVLPDEDNTTFSFAGLVTDLPLEASRGEVLTCNVTIKISGKVEIDDGS